MISDVLGDISLWEVKLAPTNMIQKVSIYFTSDTPFPAIF
jgi:hypothetical protein